MKMRGLRRLMNTIRLMYITPNSFWILKMKKPNTKLNTRAKESYKILSRWRMRCLKIGMKPKMQRLMYRRVNTLEVLFNLLDNKMDAKKIALIEVGVPK